MSSSTIDYRADLQGLRALAIILVVLAHAGMPGFAGGFVGVDVFFVLSGYLITGLLLSEQQDQGRIDYLAFIARRLRRLLPALATMLVLSMLLGTVLLSSHEFTEQTASVAYAASWTSNLFFAFTVFDYFAELHLRDIFLHTWSLGVEEQFYLFWPVLLTLLLAAGKVVHSVTSRRRLLLAGLVILFSASLALSLYWTSVTSTWGFYLMPSRIWQFTLGALVYVWFAMPAVAPRQAALGALAGPVGIVLIVGSAVLIQPSDSYPGLLALFPSIGALLVIAAGVGGQPAASRALSTPVLIWIGDRSYSWYLWHWPLLMFGFAWGLKGNPTATTALVLLALLLAMASYRWIELPLWKGRYRKLAPARAIGLSVLVIAASAFTLQQLSLSHRDAAGRGAELARAASNDTPPVYRIPDCDTWFFDAKVTPCVTHNPEGEKTALIIGDSIGMQWFSLLPGLFDGPQWRIVGLTKSSCAIVDAELEYGGNGGSFQACTDWRRQVLDDIATLNPDIIFIGSSAHGRITKEQWIDGTRRVLDRLTTVAEQVLVIPGTPQLPYNGPGCLERWLTTHGYDTEPDSTACSRPRGKDKAGQVEQYLAEAVSGYANAHLLRVNDLVCPDGVCSAWHKEGLVVYRDQQHLTDSFVRAQIDAVRGQLHAFGLRTYTRN